MMSAALPRHYPLQFAPEPGPHVLTVIEVSGLLRCSKAHVHNLINGKVHGVAPLPSLFLGRRRLVRRESLETWIDQNERGALGV